MKTNRIYIWILALVFVSALPACNKDKGDVPEPFSTTGRVYIVDTLQGTAIQKPLAGIQVFYSTTKETTGYGYIFVDTTDANGFYSFDFRLLGQDARIYARTSSGGVDYFASLDIPYHKDAEQATQDLFLVPDQGAVEGIEVSVTDSVSSQPLSAISVYRFTNRFYAEQRDYVNSVTSTSNSFGKVVFDNLPSAKYYIAIYEKRILLNRDTLVYDTIAEANLVNGAFLKVQLSLVGKLHPLSISPLQSIDVAVKDSVGGYVINNLRVCLHSNQFLAKSLTCNNSIASERSNSFGKVSFSNLDKSIQYYLIVSDTIFNSGLSDSIYYGYRELDWNSTAPFDIRILRR